MYANLVAVVANVDGDLDADLAHLAERRVDAALGQVLLGDQSRQRLSN